MRQAKKEIQISGIVCLLSLFVYTFLQFNFYRGLSNTIISIIGMQTAVNLKGYFITISSGLFASALIVLIIATKNYCIQRKKVIEDLYSAIDKIQRGIIDIQFLEFKEPYELVRAVLLECKDNAVSKSMNEDLSSKLKSLSKKKRKKIYEDFSEEYKSQQKDLLKKYIWDHHTSEYSQKVLDGMAKEEYLEQEYKNRIERYNNCLMKSIHSFAEKKMLYCDDLTVIMGDIDFLFSNKKRNNIHVNLYKRVYNQITYIRRIGVLCSNHMLYDSFDEIYLMDLIMDCQKTMLDKTEKGSGYNRYAYEIECQQDQLLEIINKHTANEKLTTGDFWVSKFCVLDKYIELSESKEKLNDKDSNK